jgi:superfamily II DNA or RNA helicase
MTPYHSKLWAHQLTRRCPPDSPELLAGTVASARVDLNPHQVDAALFAFKSPLSRGALLADEVGLGKTIEAGLVLSQRWAERRRKLLVITPSNLRKQWHQELTEKFFLPCEIFESKSYNQKLRAGNLDPLGTCESIVICSYQFARAKADVVSRTEWDLVVLDEAHRLRNVYKKSNVIANTLKLALAQPQKLLLTATPLQNSLLELHGLVGFIDDYVFGDLASFKALYARPDEQAYEDLRRRLKPICHRTLREDVRHYVSYTNRIPILQDFTPDEVEDRLYNLVSEYLRRPNLMALPTGQRTLIILVMRKLLASSSFAIAGALLTMAGRMRAKIARAEGAWQDEIGAEYEAMEATAEELDDEEEDEPLTPEQVAAMEKEIAELEGFARLASSIETNAKGQALVKALEVAFKKAEEIGALPKAVVFTESRKTQDYLLRVLADTPWGKGTVLFNGTNTDARSGEIYKSWLNRHKGTDFVTGSKSADMRAALVEEFRERGSILIATEAGAEGINLQFCSLVVNYDLPWNPQRIEQRIGRCHRYGQKHDVVVVNFLNSANEADQRVFRLLSDKFRLFEGVFGASDEILGAIESGVDFERRITEIYQDCRKPEEIREAFDRLQDELSPEIEEGMRQARRKLLEHFDDEVRDKLRIRGEQSTEQLGRFERLLLALTRQELSASIVDLDDSGFELLENPYQGRSIPTGRYELPRRHVEAHAYRLNHPLAEAVLETAKQRALPVGEIRFDLSGHPGKISVLEPWKGRSGSLVARWLSLDATAQAEDHLLIAGISDDGEGLLPEALERLWSLAARMAGTHDRLDSSRLEGLLDSQKQGILAEVQTRNTRFLVEETEKLDTWAEDVKNGLERELKELDREIREAKKAAKLEASLEGKLSQQKRVKTLETTRGNKRKALFEAQDEIDAKRDDLLNAVEARLESQAKVEELFAVQWRIE